MNKKIATEVALGIILIIAVIIGGFIWLGNRQAKSPSAQTDTPANGISPKKTLPQIAYAISYPGTVSGAANSMAGTKFDAYSEVFLSNVDGSNQRKIFTDKDKGFFFEPYSNGDIKLLNASTLLIPGRDRGTYKLSFWQFNMQTGEVSIFATLPTTGNFQPVDSSVSMSPDGSKFVYSGIDTSIKIGAGNPDNFAVFICDSSRTNPVKIYGFSGNGGITNVQWSPDGSEIAIGRGAEYHATEEGDAGTYVYNNANGQIKKVTAEAVFPWYSAWSSDGLLMSSGKKLFIGDADRNEKQVIIDLTDNGTITPIGWLK